MKTLHKILEGEDAPAWLPFALRFFEFVKRTLPKGAIFSREALPAEGVVVRARSTPARDEVYVEAGARDHFYLCFYDPDTAPNGWNNEVDTPLMSVNTGEPVPTTAPDGGVVNDRAFTKFRNTSEGLKFWHGQKPVPQLAWAGGKGSGRLRCWGGYFKEYVRGSWDKQFPNDNSLLRSDKDGASVVMLEHPTTQKIIGGKAPVTKATLATPVVAAFRTGDEEQLYGACLDKQYFLKHDIAGPCKVPYEVWATSPFSVSDKTTEWACALSGAKYTEGVVRTNTGLLTPAVLGLPAPQGMEGVARYYVLGTRYEKDELIAYGHVASDTTTFITTSEAEVWEWEEGSAWGDYTDGEFEFVMGVLARVGGGLVNTSVVWPLEKPTTGYAKFTGLELLPNSTLSVYEGDPLFGATQGRYECHAGRKALGAVDRSFKQITYDKVFANDEVLRESEYTWRVDKIRPYAVRWVGASLSVVYTYSYDAGVHTHRGTHFTLSYDTYDSPPDITLHSQEKAYFDGTTIALTLLIGGCYGITEREYYTPGDEGVSVFTLYSPDGDVLLTRDVCNNAADTRHAFHTSPTQHGVWDEKEKIGYFEVLVASTPEEVREHFMLHYDKSTEQYVVTPCLRACNFHLS